MISSLVPNDRHPQPLTKKLVLVAAALSASLCSVGWVTAADAQIVLPSTTERETPEQDLRERLEQLQEGAEAMPELPVSESGATGDTGGTVRFPSLGSAVFDAQLAGYQSYVESVGTPDILIVGSSRALQGIDPTELSYRLSVQGYDDLKVYNFSVNGATAQVVNFVVSELLPGELPRVIVWGDGSRAFNEGRRDRTWESLAASPGYQAVLHGEKPAIAIDSSDQVAEMASEVAIAPASEPESASELELALEAEPLAADRLDDSVIVRSGVTLKLVEIAELETSADEIDRLGFSAVGDRFNPAIYYREFAKVQGRYDGAYSPFVLGGRQSEALDQLAAFVDQQSSRLIFVNLPLSASYLDAHRLYYENQFQDFLVVQGDRAGFEVADLLTQWQTQPELFADPSHINQYGAAAIAQQLARDPILLLALEPAESEPTEINPVELNLVEPVPSSPSVIPTAPLPSESP